MSDTDSSPAEYLALHGGIAVSEATDRDTLLEVERAASRLLDDIERALTHDAVKDNPAVISPTAPVVTNAPKYLRLAYAVTYDAGSDDSPRARAGLDYWRGACIRAQRSPTADALARQLTRSLNAKTEAESRADLDDMVRLSRIDSRARSARRSAERNLRSDDAGDDVHHPTTPYHAATLGL